MLKLLDDLTTNTRRIRHIHQRLHFHASQFLKVDPDTH